jgi:hypothetical protein
VDPELIEYLDRRFTQFKDELRTEIRADIAASAEETRRYVDTTAAETRLLFEVVAERLMDKIQLVGEGVLGVDQKVERLATEMRGEFQKVDRRFLHLQARVSDRRD